MARATSSCNTDQARRNNDGRGSGGGGWKSPGGGGESWPDVRFALGSGSRRCFASSGASCGLSDVTGCGASAVMDRLDSGERQVGWWCDARQAKSNTEKHLKWQRTCRMGNRGEPCGKCAREG